MNAPVRHSKRLSFLIAVLIFAFYVVSAKLGLKLAFINASATAIWAPTGIALAAFLLFGEQFWPCVFGGAFLVNYLTDGSFITSIVIAGGNTLEGLLGSLLVRQFANGRKAFERSSDIVKFIVFAEIISTAVSPSIGVTILCLQGYASWLHYSEIWLTWWLGDLTGALLVTPFLVLWADYPRVSLHRIPIMLASFLLVGLTGQAVFANWLSLSPQMPLEFLCVPPLIWIAFRFGLRDTATASLVLAAVALWNTIHGNGPFNRSSPNQSLLLLQVFMGVVSTTSLALAAAITERQTVEENLERVKKAEKNLQEKVELIQLLQSITVAANESLNLPEAVQLSLMLICRYLGWPVGHVYYVDQANERLLKPGAQWFIRDEHKYKNLRQVTDERVFHPGEGLPGMVFTSGLPQWIEDVTHFDNFPRAKTGLDIKVRAAFGFPILIGKKVAAVLEFFTDHPVPPDLDLMESMKHIGTQLGRVIERYNAEQTQSELALLVETSSDFIVTTNPEGYLLYLNEAGRTMVGLDKNSNIGVMRHEDFVFEKDIPKLRGEVLTSIMTQGHWEGEFLLRNFKTGEPVTVYFSTSLLKDPQTGLPSTLAAIGHNVTDIKKAGAEIKNTNSFLGAVLENIPNMIFVKDAKDLRFVMFNKAGEQLLGIPRESMMGKNDYDFFPREQADFFTSVDKRVIAGKKLLDIPREDIRTKDKGTRVLHTKKIPVLNEDGSPRFLLGISEDITEKINTEMELTKQTQLLRSIIDNMGEGLLVCDSQGKTLFVNPAADHMLGGQIGDTLPGGKKQKNVVYKSDGETVLIPEEFPVTRAIYGESSDNVELYIKNDQRSNGIYIIATSRPIRDSEGKITGAVSVFRDITEQKLAEEERQRLVTLVEHSRDMIVWSTPEGKNLYINDAGRAMIGIDPQVDVNSIKPEVFFTPEEITGLKAMGLQQRQTILQRGFWEGEISLRHQKTGKSVPIHFSMVMLKNSKTGKPLGTATIGRDMTERQEAEKNLRESEMRFRSVVRSSPNAIIIADHDGHILSWNQGADKIFGYTEDEMTGQSLVKIMPTKYREAHVLDMKHLSEKGGSDLIGKTVELEGLRKNGKEFPLELTLSTWKVENQAYFGGIIRDITERKKMEDLSRSNTELQQFANVASHDLQEPLRMVASYVQLLSEHLKGRLDTDAVEYMNFAVDGAKRMQLLVNGLLEYSRVESRGQPPQLVDMNKIFGQTLSDLEILIAETGAKITHNTLPQVMGDPVQLAQLMQNLFSNALKFQKPGIPEIDFSVQETENEWVFACKDNGIGIDPKYFGRIFVIFQRLHHRDEYSGTGIGLAICKRIVERHRGRIWVESQPGLGATFFFTLPKRNE